MVATGPVIMTLRKLVTKNVLAYVAGALGKEDLREELRTAFMHGEKFIACILYSCSLM